MLQKVYPILLLCVSNMFMTYAWYGHLKDLAGKPVIIVILLSWCVAFFEYCFQVPANRLGFRFYSLGQLKIMQEVISMGIFALFSILYMKDKPNLDFLCAALCMLGAVFFMFRSHL